MEHNDLIKTSSYSLKKLGSALAITEKLLQDYNPLGLPDLIPYRKGNKWGFCNRKKEIVIACVYDKVGQFSEGLAAISIGFAFSFRDNNIGKLGFIDTKGDIVIPMTYEFKPSHFLGGTGIKFNEGFVSVKKDKKIC